MQLRYFLLTIMLFLVSNDFCFAQQSAKLTVPEGTIVHFRPCFCRISIRKLGHQIVNMYYLML